MIRLKTQVFVVVPTAHGSLTRPGRVWGRAFTKNPLYDIMLDDNEIVQNVPADRLTVIPQESQAA